MSEYQTSQFGMKHSNTDEELKATFDDLFETLLDIQTWCWVEFSCTCTGSCSCGCTGSCICPNP